MMWWVIIGAIIGVLIAVGKALPGNVKPEMICPHCQVKGKVHTKPTQRKRGLSGGKIVGGLLTGGISILATGLSRKVLTTEAHCDNCGATWDF